MEVAKLLIYQEIDKALEKLEKELKGDDSAKKVAYYNNALNSAAEELKKIDRNTEEMMKSFERLETLYAKTEQGIGDIAAFVGGVDNGKEVDYYTTEVEKLKVSLESLESDGRRLQKKLEEAFSRAKEEQTKGMQSRAKLDIAKKEFSSKKNEMTPKAQEIMKKLELAAVGIPQEELKKYAEIRKKKTPVLVPYGEKACGGCGMELSSSTCEKVEGGQVVECSTCGRLVFKPLKQ